MSREVSREGNEPLSGGIETIIRSRIPELRGAEKRVAEFILGDLEGTAGRSIAETALATGTSTASVTRFSRAIGLSGYPALRLELAALVGRGHSEAAAWRSSVGASISATDSAESVLATLVAADIKIATQTAEQLDLEAVDRFVERILAARRIDIYASGGSALVAEEFSLRLSRLAVFPRVFRDVHSAIVSACLLDPSDLVIGVSHSGETVDVVEPLQEAVRRGASVVAVTSFPGSTVASLADEVLMTTTGDLTYRSDAAPARNAQQLVLDLVFMRIAQSQHDLAIANLTSTADAVRKHNARVKKTDTDPNR